MSRFDNKLCPICRTPLNDKSDVVVCPECGTPHHRACYLAAGHCGAEEFHAQGFEWKGFLPGEEPQEQPQPKPDEFSDSRAEYPGGQSAQYDREINQERPMDFEQYIERLYDDSRGEDGVSSKELSTFVGRSVMHYSQAFAAFRAPTLPGQKKRRIFFNVCAGFFAPIHQFYRRMDLLGIAWLALDMLYYVPTMLSSAGIGSAEMLAGLRLGASALAFAAMVLLCLFGDYLYYRFAVKRIQKIRMRFDDGRAEGYYEALAEKGTPSWLRAIAAMLAVYLLQYVLLFFIGQL